VRGTLNFHPKFLGKQELFQSPLGWFFRSLGGIPVDRSKRNDLVQQVGEMFRNQPGLILALAPEGTRKNEGVWKTGFYHMALIGKVPIVFCSIDYPSKTVTMHPPFWPCGTYEKDIPAMEMMFKDAQGKHRGILPMRNPENGTGSAKSNSGD
jgi:1-acyl-sn-glycerol-3-phosphate acyltransferase